MAPTLELFCATTAYLLSFDEWRDGSRFVSLLAELKERGYSGVETNIVHMLLMGRDRFATALEAAGMKWIAKAYSSGSNCPGNHGIKSDNPAIVHERDGRDVQAHLRVWIAQLKELEYERFRPLVVQVSSQSGRDYFCEAESDAFFAGALAAAKAVGVAVHHETHRGRLLYNPWDCIAATKRWSDLTLLADLSHYVVVCEAGPSDPELNASVSQLVPRIRHIHARVGFEEGPQVPDFRDPKWSEHVDAHVRWWTAAFDAAAERGDARVTVTPEFLPAAFGYGWSDAYTGAPLTDIIDINHHMAAYVARVYAERFGADYAPVICTDKAMAM